MMRTRKKSGHVGRIHTTLRRFKLRSVEGSLSVIGFRYQILISKIVCQRMLVDFQKKS